MNIIRSLFHYDVIGRKVGTKWRKCMQHTCFCGYLSRHYIIAESDLFFRIASSDKIVVLS